MVNFKMPFDFEAYQRKCNEMTKEELHEEWDNHIREIAAGSTSTATSFLFFGATGGVSLGGLGISVPRIQNARRKREVIQAGLKSRGTTHHTHAKDILVPVARELAKAPDVEAFGLGLQQTNNLPQDPPILERYGPQLGPVVHQYAVFGHLDEPVEAQAISTIQAGVSQYDTSLFQAPHSDGSSLSDTYTTWPSLSNTSISLASISTDAVSTTSVFNPVSEPVVKYSSTAQLDEQIQNIRASSLPSSNSSYSIPRKKIARAESDYPKPLQSLPFGMPNATINDEGDTTPQAIISDEQLDNLVATLSDEEQMMLLMKLELEIRSPGGSQLHRTKAVHASNARRPHMQRNDMRTSRHLSETHFTESGLMSSPRASIQLSDVPFDLDESSPPLPPRNPSLPLRPSQAQQPALPPRSESLPIRMNDPESTESTSMEGITHSSITRKPLVTSPRQSYSSQLSSLQSQPTYLEYFNQNSGSYSKISMPSIPTIDVLPQYTPLSFHPTANFQENGTQGQQGSQSSISSNPPPPYYQLPLPTPVFSHRDEDISHVPSHSNGMHQTAEFPKPFVSDDRESEQGLFGWQWGPASEKPADSLADGSIYAPVPIPDPWNG